MGDVACNVFTKYISCQRLLQFKNLKIMKIIKIILILSLIVSMISCTQSENKTEGSSVVTPNMEGEVSPPATVMNIDSVVKNIDQRRKFVEENKGEPITISTAELREKIKQKWEKIHFYTIDGKVARIKTYPYDQISKRTEEFYFDNGKLVLAVIEEDGSGESGKEDQDIDKMFYFHDNEMIKGVRKGDEKEYGEKDLDAKKLMEEANEYLDIYAKRK